jgi:phage replication-related protein YjqB (UPF0714/DUF867 family)
MDKYKNFDELNRNEEDDTYSISYEMGSSGIAIITPHGGGIEPGTSEIVKGVAGNEHSFYTFDGLKQNNKCLHITSENFDEPNCVELVRQSDRVVAIHGWKRNDNCLCLGGLDQNLKNKIQTTLINAGFKVVDCPEVLKGEGKKNICNRNRDHYGVQIEISRGLRDRMFELNTKKGRSKKTPIYHLFVKTLREALNTL